MFNVCKRRLQILKHKSLLTGVRQLSGSQHVRNMKTFEKRHLINSFLKSSSTTEHPECGRDLDWRVNNDVQIDLREEEGSAFVPLTAHL